MKNNLPSIRFDKFKSNWSIRQIGDLLIDVSRPIKMDDYQSYQLVTVKRRNAGIVSRGYFKGKDVLVKSQFVVKTGDYLISKRQIVHGANGIVPEHLSNSIVSNEYLVLHGTNELSVEYLSIISKLPIMYKMFYLSSYGVDIEKLVFNVSDWKKRELVIPSIEEQNEITLFFNELDRYITLHQQELNALKQTKQGFFQKMFPRENEYIPLIRFEGFNGSWETKNLGDVLESIYNGQTPSRDRKDFWDGQINWLTSGELNRGIVKSTIEKITELGQSNSNLKIIPKNTFVIAITGLEAAGTRGNCGILDIDTTLNQSCMALFPKKDLLDTTFLFQWYRKVGEKYGLRFTQGTKQQSYNAEIIKKLEICLPSLDEQIQIGKFFKELDEVIELKEQELEALKQTKKGFLQKMFL